jgi:hypothetical protein
MNKRVHLLQMLAYPAAEMYSLLADGNQLAQLLRCIHCTMTVSDNH